MDSREGGDRATVECLDPSPGWPKMFAPLAKTRSLLPLLCLLLVTACRPTSVEECRHRASPLISNLVAELEDVQTTNDLRAAAPQLQKLFLEFADLMIAVEKLPLEGRLPDGDHPLAIRLKEEMRRIYAIEGARTILEEIQAEPLHRLGRHFGPPSRERELQMPFGTG